MGLQPAPSLAQAGVGGRGCRGSPLCVSVPSCTGLQLTGGCEDVYRGQHDSLTDEKTKAQRACFAPLQAVQLLVAKSVPDLGFVFLRKVLPETLHDWISHDYFEVSGGLRSGEPEHH